jgi:hypothetical protein
MANININDHSEKRISLAYDPTTDSYKAQEILTIDDLTSKGSTISNFAISGANGTVLLANKNREEFYVQNLATGALYVKYGANAHSSSFNFLLAGNTSANAGDGGSLSDLNYSGIVSVSGANASTPSYIVWERL